jgi:hypothetical protein
MRQFVLPPMPAGCLGRFEPKHAMQLDWQMPG